MSISSFWDLFRTTLVRLPATAGLTVASPFSETLPSLSSAVPTISTLLGAMEKKGTSSPLKQVVQGSSGFASGGLLPGLIAGLFSGIFGSTPVEQQTAPKFTLPPPIQIDAGISPRTRSVGLADYSSSAQARLMEPPQAAGGAPSVVIQIQALDSQSIMDRSNEIATAVREAVLNSHPLGSLLRE